MIHQLLNTNKVFNVENKLYTQQGLGPMPFQENYINIREAENRIHSIDFIKRLPEVPKRTPYYNEWRIRRKSSQKLLHYLSNQKNIANILEIGCGNGWLTHLIATSSEYNVVGLDVNLLELKQASDAFGSSSRVHFVFGNIFDDIFASGSFDVVIFAASFQYFSDVEKLFAHTFPLLRNNGEIHILDSPFYKPDQLSEAKKRSSQYFSSVGHAEMEKYYFHHSLDILKGFNIEMMYNPGTPKNRILRKWFVKDLSPFPWIRIRNNKH